MSKRPTEMTEDDLIRLGFHLRLVEGPHANRTEWHREQAMNPGDYACEFCRNRDWGTVELLTTAITCAAPFIDKPVLDWAVL